MLLFVCGAVVGYQIGRGDAPAPDALAAVPASQDGALVDVLARVDATADPRGASRLSFPDALRTVEPLVGPAPPVVQPDELESAAMKVELGAGVSTAGVDPRPAGAFTVQLGRFSAPEDAIVLRDAAMLAGATAVWIGVERLGGGVEYVVASGGYADEEQAAAAAEALPADVGAPVVTELK
jgi:septal ring-binding cell division protein DamX